MYSALAWRTDPNLTVLLNPRLRMIVPAGTCLGFYPGWFWKMDVLDKFVNMTAESLDHNNKDRFQAFIKSIEKGVKQVGEDTVIVPVDLVTRIRRRAFDGMKDMDPKDYGLLALKVAGPGEEPNVEKVQLYQPALRSVNIAVITTRAVMPGEELLLKSADDLKTSTVHMGDLQCSLNPLFQIYRLGYYYDKAGMRHTASGDAKGRGVYNDLDEWGTPVYRPRKSINFNALSKVNVPKLNLNKRTPTVARFQNNNRNSNRNKSSNNTNTKKRNEKSNDSNNTSYRPAKKVRHMRNY